MVNDFMAAAPDSRLSILRYSVTGEPTPFRNSTPHISKGYTDAACLNTPDNASGVMRHSPVPTALVLLLISALFNGTEKIINQILLVLNTNAYSDGVIKNTCSLSFLPAVPAVQS